jgi:hypothetical protein
MCALCRVHWHQVVLSAGETDLAYVPPVLAQTLHSPPCVHASCTGASLLVRCWCGRATFACTLGWGSGDCTNSAEVFGACAARRACVTAAGCQPVEPAPGTVVRAGCAVCGVTQLWAVSVMGIMLGMLNLVAATQAGGSGCIAAALLLDMCCSAVRAVCCCCF